MYLCFSCVSLINRFNSSILSTVNLRTITSSTVSTTSPFSPRFLLWTRTHIRSPLSAVRNRMLERKWTGSGLTLGPQLSPGAQSIVRHNAVKQGRKERVCYNYSIYHIMFNELILKGTVHPNITKHWKIWNTPHEFYGLFLWWFYVVLLSFFGLDSLLPLLLNATYVDYYDVLWVFGLSFWRHPFTADNLLVSKWCNAKFLQICSNEEQKKIILNLGWLEDEYIFSNSSFLGELLL